MTGYSEFIGLSPRSGAIIDHLDSPPKLQRSLFSSLSPGDSSPGLSVETSVSSTKSSFDITVDNKLVSPIQTLAANKPRASCPLLLKQFFFYPMHYECYYCLISHRTSMRRQMDMQRKMTLLSPVLHLLPPSPYSHLKPWRWQAVSSNLKRNNGKRPRSPILVSYKSHTLRTIFPVRKCLRK